MIEVVASSGYADATIARVVAQAGVSQPTFYEHFSDKQDGFIQTLREIQQQLKVAVEASIEKASPVDARANTIKELIALASSSRAAALLLTNEAMAGGPHALDMRDQGITEIARLIDVAESGLSPDTPTPDLATEVALGAVYRLIAQRLRHGQSDLVKLAHELSAWMESYEVPISRHRWAQLEPVELQRRSRFAPATPLRAPEPAPPGSSRRARRANQRERIMFAAAEAAQAKGYTESTVADIVRIAGVDYRAFSALFDSKQDAYMAVHEFGVLRVMAATAGGFFSGGSWSQRAWEAGRAFTQVLDNNPAIAHIGFVEAYAVGPAAVKRLEESLDAFTLFLQQGQRLSRRGAQQPKVAIEAISVANFEMAYRQTRKGPDARLAGLLPHAIFISLAPFMGADATNEFIRRQLQSGGET